MSGRNRATLRRTSPTGAVTRTPRYIGSRTEGIVSTSYAPPTSFCISSGESLDTVNTFIWWPAAASARAARAAALATPFTSGGNVSVKKAILIGLLSHLLWGDRRELNH